MSSETSKGYITFSQCTCTSCIAQNDKQKKTLEKMAKMNEAILGQPGPSPAHQATPTSPPPPAPKPIKKPNSMTWTKERWDTELSDKGRWDVIVAMRGPDSYYGETLKWFTTSVIRGRVREVFRVGGSVNTDLKLVILPNGIGSVLVKDKKDWNTSHFIEHIEQAAYWLKVPILWIKDGIWHHAMGSLSSKDAITCFLSNREAGDEQGKLYSVLEKHLEKIQGGHN